MEPQRGQKWSPGGFKLEPNGPRWRPGKVSMPPQQSQDPDNSAWIHREVQNGVQEGSKWSPMAQGEGQQESQCHFTKVRIVTIQQGATEGSKMDSRRVQHGAQWPKVEASKGFNATSRASEKLQCRLGLATATSGCVQGSTGPARARI